MRRNLAGLFLISLLVGCASAAATETVSTPKAVDQGANDDCFAVGDVSAREECFARMSEEEIAECARLKPLACRPYKDMWGESAKIDGLMAEIAKLSRNAYATYGQSDAAYLDDLAKGLKDADIAWRKHRDAHCRLQPLLEGMARREAGDLTEACRLDLTRQRVSELESIVSSLKAEVQP